jgi:hypothetical protein
MTHALCAWDGPTGTLGELIHGPLPIPLDLFQSLQRSSPGFDDLGEDVLLNLMLDHSESLRCGGQTGTRDELRGAGPVARLPTGRLSAAGPKRD